MGDYFGAMRRAYSIGFSNGLDIGEENRYSVAWRSMDEFIEACMTHESDIFRQYSPFEFYAKEFNSHEFPEGIWESYERGVYRGVCKAWG